MHNPSNIKTVLITGSTRGIGQAIAHHFAQHGYHLLLVSNSLERLKTQNLELLTINPSIQVHYFQADLREKNEIYAVCDWAESYHPDVLVNNVGLFEPFSLLGEDQDLMEKLWNINYLAAHQLCRTLGKQMKARKSGHIFNIGSTASRNPVQAASYTVTKFAIMGLTNVLREELKDHGVKVTEIVPGSTRTSSWDGTTISDNDFVKPEDVAQALYQCMLLSGNSNVDEIVIRPQKGNIISDPLE